MESCIYEGEVRHRRYRPVEHTFRYRMFMMYLDLDELDRVFDGSLSWTIEGRGLANFRRKDHHGRDDVPLDEAIRTLVADRTGRRPTGPVRLLTHLSYFGYRFNPVSFFYCFGEDGRALQAIVAEINNTPWGEQHCYVLEHPGLSPDCENHRYQFAKEFHISPFMDMTHQYDWRLTTPGERLTVLTANFEGGSRLFDASLSMRRREISPSSLRGALLRYPLMTARVMLGIYYQAMRLWLKRTPTFAHPQKRLRPAGKSV